jgi:hypothetical protein
MGFTFARSRQSAHDPVVPCFSSSRFPGDAGYCKMASSHCIQKCNPSYATRFSESIEMTCSLLRSTLIEATPFLLRMLLSHPDYDLYSVSYMHLYLGSLKEIDIQVRADKMLFTAFSNPEFSPDEDITIAGYTIPRQVRVSCPIRTLVNVS